MKLKIGWNATTTGPAVEFYTCWWSRPGLTPHKKIVQGTSTELTLTDGPGLYRIEITACLADERCSEPVVLEWYCDDHSHPLQVEIESMRLTDEGPMLGFNAKPDATYTLQRATYGKLDEWADVVWNIRGNGFTEIPALSNARSRIIETKEQP